MMARPDHNVPDVSILDLLSPHAWRLVERYDNRVSTDFMEGVPDVEEFIRDRYEFTLRVLVDIASLPSTTEEVSP